MHLRTALVAIVLAASLAGCLDVRNMAELKAALGFTVEEEALPPLAPTARAMAFPTLAKAGEPVLFTAAGSGDPEGRDVVHLWDFADGTRGQGEEVRHAFREAGAYRVELTVSDPDGLWDVAAVEVRVLPDNVAPEVAIRVLDDRGEPAERTVPDTPLVLRAAVRDPEGADVALAWDFGDGSVATAEQARHAWAAPGRYTVTLTATDAAGLANRTAVAVAVDHVAAHAGVVAASDAQQAFAFPGGAARELVATVAYDAAFGANDLVLRVVDGAGNAIAASALVPEAGAQAVEERVTLDAAALAAGEPGPWSLVVERASGVRVPFTATVEVRW